LSFFHRIQSGGGVPLVDYRISIWPGGGEPLVIFHPIQSGGGVPLVDYRIFSPGGILPLAHFSIGNIIKF
jgi:hypothetical protein